MDTRYEPTVWADGDKVTADRLNKMELAVTAMYENQEPLMVTFTGVKADKKYSEVLNAYKNGRTVLFDLTDPNGEMMVAVVSGVYLGTDISASPITALYPSGYSGFVVTDDAIKLHQPAES